MFQTIARTMRAMLYKAKALYVHTIERLQTIRTTTIEITILIMIITIVMVMVLGLNIQVYPYALTQTILQTPIGIVWTCIKYSLYF